MGDKVPEREPATGDKVPGRDFESAKESDETAGKLKKEHYDLGEFKSNSENAKELRKIKAKAVRAGVDATTFDKNKKRPESWYNDMVEAANEIKKCFNVLDFESKNWYFLRREVTGWFGDMKEYDEKEWKDIEKYYEGKIYGKKGMFNLLCCWNRAKDIHPELDKADEPGFDVKELGDLEISLVLGDKVNDESQRFAEKEPLGKEDMPDVAAELLEDEDARQKRLEELRKKRAGGGASAEVKPEKTTPPAKSSSRAERIKKLRERQKAEERASKQPPAPNPLPSNTETAPSPDVELPRVPEKTTKKPKAYVIKPPLHGNYKVAVFTKWENGEWKKEPQNLKPYEYGKNLTNIRTISGKAGGRVIIPLPHGYRLKEGSVKVKPSVPVNVQENQHGVAYITFKAATNTVVEYSFEFGEDSSFKLTRSPQTDEKSAILDESALQSDTQSLLDDLKGGGASNIDKANRIKGFVLKNFKYAQDAKLSAYYRKNNSSKYFQRLDENRVADCDVANAFFAALCREVGVPARQVGGYSSEEIDDSSILSSSNLHGWTEIWDGEKWVEFDATPTAVASAEEAKLPTPEKKKDEDEEPYDPDKNQPAMEKPEPAAPKIEDIEIPEG